MLKNLEVNFEEELLKIIIKSEWFQDQSHDTDLECLMAFGSSIAKIFGEQDHPSTESLIQALNKIAELPLEADIKDRFGIYICEPIYDLGKRRREVVLKYLSTEFIKAFWENQKYWHKHVTSPRVHFHKKANLRPRDGFRSTKRIKTRKSSSE